MQPLISCKNAPALFPARVTAQVELLFPFLDEEVKEPLPASKNARVSGLENDCKDAVCRAVIISYSAAVPKTQWHAPPFRNSPVSADARGA